MRGLFIACLLMVTTSCFTQALIARSSLGATTFYTTLNSAYSACINGDTLYLPGGAFEAPSQFIKRLHIFGAGAKIDSSIATGNTKIFTLGTEIKINTGAAFSSFEGIYFDDPVVIGSTAALDNDLNNIVFKSCDFGGHELKFGATIPSPVNNISVINCIVSTLSAQKAENCVYYNSIFYGIVYNTKNSFFKNSLLLNSQQFNENTTYENCYLAGLAGFYDTYCYFLNCILASCCNGPTNNFVNTINCSPVFTVTDYHLAAGCAGINGGTDGTDVGIYGGAFAWKGGVIPTNPHISFKLIPDVSNSEGTFDVNIKVNAQDN